MKFPKRELKLDTRKRRGPHANMDLHRVNPSPPKSVFVDHEYVLVLGQRTNGLCRYPPSWGQYRAERIVESDEEHCAEIVSRGVFLGPPVVTPESHTVISTFRVSLDSTVVRADTMRRDRLRRRP